MRKRSSTVRTTRWSLIMPAEVAGQVDNLLWDHALGKPIYGARTRLATRLFKDFLRRLDTDMEALAILEEVKELEDVE